MTIPDVRRIRPHPRRGDDDLVPRAGEHVCRANEVEPLGTVEGEKDDAASQPGRARAVRHLGVHRCALARSRRPPPRLRRDHSLGLHAHAAALRRAPVRGRVVVDRNRITGGGVAAGIDFGLRLASILASESAARSIQLGLEYDPDPPFRSGNPDVAEAALVTQVRAQLGVPETGGSVRAEATYRAVGSNPRACPQRMDVRTYLVPIVVRAHYAIACVRCIATAEVCARRAAGLDGAPWRRNASSALAGCTTRTSRSATSLASRRSGSRGWAPATGTAPRARGRLESVLRDPRPHVAPACDSPLQKRAVHVVPRIGVLVCGRYRD
jgi:hypothetical protein